MWHERAVPSSDAKGPGRSSQIRRSTTLTWEVVGRTVECIGANCDAGGTRCTRTSPARTSHVATHSDAAAVPILGNALRHHTDAARGLCSPVFFFLPNRGPQLFEILCTSLRFNLVVFVVSFCGLLAPPIADFVSCLCFWLQVLAVCLRSPLARPAARWALRTVRSCAPQGSRKAMSETGGAVLGHRRRLGVGARQYGHHRRPSSGPALMADPAGAAVVTATIGHRIEP